MTLWRWLEYGKCDAIPRDVRPPHSSPRPERLPGREPVRGPCTADHHEACALGISVIAIDMAFSLACLRVSHCSRPRVSYGRGFVASSFIHWIEGPGHRSGRERGWMEV